jgi:hypothetical protein
MVALSSFRTAAAGSYEGSETAQLALLLPHLYRAMKVFLRMASVSALAQASTQIIDRLLAVRSAYRVFSRHRPCCGRHART